MFKYHKYNRLFLTEDGGGDFGGDDDTGSDQTPAPAPAPSQSLDPKAFATEFGNVIAEQFKKRDEGQPKVHSPEEIAKAKKDLGFFEIDDNFLRDFDNNDTRKSSLEKFRDGVFQQSINVARALIEQQQQAFTQQLTPLQSLIQERQKEETWGKFNQDYKSLSSPKLRPLLEAVGAQLNASGKFSGLTQDQAFTVLANAAADVIKETNPAFVLEKTNQQSNSGRNSNAIPSTTFGSNGGGSNGGNPGGGKKPSAVSILGPISAPRK